MRSRAPEGDAAAMTSWRNFRAAVAALRHDRARAHFELLPDDVRAAVQRGRLDALVEHAMKHSPFYREWYREQGVQPGAALAELPVMTKAMLMANWDDVPTDRSLRLDAAREALATGDGVVGRHHVFQTGGSSGEPAVFAYDTDAMAELLANYFRCPRINGIAPRLPKRIGMSVLFAPGRLHMAARLSALADVGLFRMQRLPVSAPVGDLARALERHRPDVIGGYAATVALLALQQIDGRLDIAPRTVITSSEPLTDAHRERIRQAWGVEAFDAYATTETGPLAQECSAHRGEHVFEDTVLLEVEQNRILVTNLFNRGFPLIRFAVDDLVTLGEGPCPCGRTTARIASISGRSNDIMLLPSADRPGERIAVHPSAWTPVTALASIADAEITFDGAQLRMLVVARSSETEAEDEARRYVLGTFRELGVGDITLSVAVVDSLPRTAAGKRQLVRNLG